MYTLILTYAALLFVGGLFGYFKAGSIASLIMSSSFTLLLLTWTYLDRKGLKWSRLALLATIFFLDAFFSWRFIKTHALFPAGFFSLFSTILLIIIALRIQKK